MNNLKSSFPKELVKAPRKSKTWVFKAGSRRENAITLLKGVQEDLHRHQRAKRLLLDAKEKILKEKRRKAIVKVKVMEGYSRLPLKNDGRNYYVQPRNKNGSFAKKVVLGKV